MPDRKLTIIIPDGDPVEDTVATVQTWLSRGMTSGYYPDWTLRDVTEQKTAKEIVKIVLGLESLGTWEQRLEAAVHLARSEAL